MTFFERKIRKKIREERKKKKEYVSDCMIYFLSAKQLVIFTRFDIHAYSDLTFRPNVAFRGLKVVSKSFICEEFLQKKLNKS